MIVAFLYLIFDCPAVAQLTLELLEQVR